MNDFDKGPDRKTISEKDLFKKIILAPREAFRFINDYKYEKHLYILLFLAGIVRSFDRASSKNMGDNYSIWAIIAIGVIAGGLFGWISYYIYAALISWSGKWMNGKGNTESILRILAYALFPSILSLIILIPHIAIYGNDIFKSENGFYSSGLVDSIIYYSFTFIEIVFGIWSVVLCVIAISEVQKLSIGKSILNLILPVILVIFLMLILFLPFQLFN
jgi:hypothetical protein